MMSEVEVIASIDALQADTLQRWIDHGWVLPHQDDAVISFDQSDVMRIRLICELHFDLHIEEDSLSVVLSLMDQLYATRRQLRQLREAVAAQPPIVRAGISSFIKPTQ